MIQPFTAFVFVEIEDHFFVGEFVLGDFHWMGVLGVVALMAAKKNERRRKGFVHPFNHDPAGN
jgi:hypothetical protein